MSQGTNTREILRGGAGRRLHQPEDPGPQTRRDPDGAWRKSAPRPPWTTEAGIRDACTSCGACITACPEGILFAGPAKTPIIDFKNGACTFCGACAEACSEPVFAPTVTRPWDLVARIGPDCFLTHGVSCRSCGDACDETAITFELRVGGFGELRMDPEKCSGCGACIGVCPASAISLEHQNRKEAAA